MKKIAAFLLCLIPAGAAHSEERFTIRGLADAEVWNTASEPDFLARNEGDPASLGRLRLWGAGNFTDRLQGFVLGEVTGGTAAYDGETEVDLEQAYLRYTFSAPRRMVVQAGRVILPLGGFSQRYFSSRNPLIGEPLNYEVSYPVGLELVGSVGRFDYTVAAMDRPITAVEDLPNPGSVARPAIAAGLTPAVGFRIGAYATEGPYLNHLVERSLPQGAGWRDFSQRVLGLDFQFSRGHLELNGEVTRPSYEIPGRADVKGSAGYIEPKYTFSPRWFGVVRVERADLISITPVSGTSWLAETARTWDVETGVGYRIDPRLLLKVSYRVAREKENPASTVPGHAVAAQLSYDFDVKSWFERPR